MRANKQISILTAVLVLCLTDGCGRSDSLESGHPSKGRTDTLRPYRLVESSLHRGLLIASINLTNGLLNVGTKYQLEANDSPAEDRISVYLVAGDHLGDSEYAFILDRERSIVVNADRIVELVRQFGSDYDDGQIVEPRPMFGIFPSKQDYARKVLAVILMHEMGHIWQKDHGSYSGLPTVSYNEILSASGATRNIELEADKFCADQIRMSLEAEERLSQDPGRYLRNQGVFDTLDVEGVTARAGAVGRHARALSDFRWFLLEVARNIKPRKPFEGKISVSHLDFDIRIMILLHAGYSLNLEYLILNEVHDRLAEAQFQVAWKAVVVTAPLGANRYYPYVQLLRHADIMIRSQAARALRREEPHSDEILPELIEALNQKYGETHGITYTLSTFGRRAVPDLILSLKSRNPKVRYGAALCLLQMGPRENAGAIPALRKAATDRDKDVKEKIFLILRGHEPSKSNK